MLRFVSALGFVALSAGLMAQDRPNVLFLMVDDLRPDLGCYGASHVKSPRIDALARRGVRFARAYCQQALCNPSRTSLLTGMRPDSIGVTGNHVHFRGKHPDVVTLPEHFKKHGYRAEAMGKIYHGEFPDGASKTKWDTMGDPQSSWRPAVRFGPRYYYTESGIEQAKASFRKMYRPKDPGPDDWTKKLVFGPMTEAPDVTDATLYDGKVADAAIEALRRLKTRRFFLAVGFIKPHTPFVAPKKYWELYDAKSVRIAGRATLPDGAPKRAGHNSGEIRRYTDQPKRGAFTGSGQRRLRHGYYACVSYIDAMVGRVLDELDRLDLTKNTIVVLLGDHGYHLGEYGLWGKVTNFELAARVPLIVAGPGVAEHGTSAALTELLDLYPTVCRLAGVPIPKHVEGRPFVRRLHVPSLPGKDAAFTQVGRGRLRGASIRTNRFRYTEWRQQRKVVARELYDHWLDPDETRNVVADPRHADAIETLSKRRPK